VEISVENISKVDRVITIKADGADLEPRIDKALREYRKQMSLPGFRPGKAPMSIVRKRFGRDVENEQVNEYIQEIFEKEIVPEHNPVGEPEMTKMEYENGELEVVLKIGITPEFDLAEVSSLTVDKLVHDVTDDEVEKEYEHTFKRFAEWKETEEPASDDSRVTVDAAKLDADGKLIPGDIDTDMELDLGSEENADYKDALLGKKAGDDVDLTMGEGDEAETFRLSVKKVETFVEPAKDEALFQKASNNQAKTEEEFRSYLKSQIQNYFDNAADELFRDRIVDAMIKAHDFDVPESIQQEVLKGRVNRIAEQNEGKLPEDFDMEGFKEESKETMISEGKWVFISNKLFEKYPDIELKPEDVDEFFDTEAARMGLPAEMLKNFYASNTNQLEQLRMRIRTDKLFDKITAEVGINELSRDVYEEKYQKKGEEAEDASEV